jgi:hypothetical protein
LCVSRELDLWTPTLESARGTRETRAVSMSDWVVENPDSYCEMGNSQEDMCDEDMTTVRQMHGKRRLSNSAACSLRHVERLYTSGSENFAKCRISYAPKLNVEHV